MAELSYLYPEIWLLSMALFILIFDLYLPHSSKWITYLLSQLTLLGVLCLTLNLLDKEPVIVFNHMFVLDKIGILLKSLIVLFGFFVFLYSRKYLFERQIYKSEYFVLCLFSILGMSVLVSAGHFLSLYLGIELLALPLYALITIVREDEVAPEAAMKYFVMGALASGLLLYGISLLYGVTGSFEMKKIAFDLISRFQEPHPALLFGLVFVITGLAFKFGAVPFHMWLPDVYQGAPNSVTLFIGTLPKLAAFGFAIRILIDTFAVYSRYWQLLLVIMAILSLIIGNLLAIAQSNIKRMLAYSTIAHIGFLFLGLLTGSQSGFAAALNYVIVYALMALGGFGIITLLSYQGFEVENIQDFRGLSVRKPWTAFLMMVVLLSLSGIPPFAGFYAKLFILAALIEAEYIWLAVLAVLLTVVGAYYYLRVIRVMFFDSPSKDVQFGVVAKVDMVALSINGLSLLFLGFFPAYLFNLCLNVLATLQ